MSLATFPNCSITLSCSDGGGGAGCDGVGAPAEGCVTATSWKFLTDATVTLPLKLRHQHCNWSCHRGALLRRTNGRSLHSSLSPRDWPPLLELPIEMSENRVLLNRMDRSLIDDLRRRCCQMTHQGSEQGHCPPEMGQCHQPQWTRQVWSASHSSSAEGPGSPKRSAHTKPVLYCRCWMGPSATPS